jgi:prevent-host-death family protein
MHAVRNEVSAIQKQKKVSTAEAKNKLSALIGLTITEGTNVVIERRGEPKAVLVSYTEYEETQQIRARSQRLEALERLRTLREQVSARFDGVSEAERAQLAVRFSREFVQDLADEGKVAFQRMQK